MAVKMIMVGQRVSILTREHCIPFDVVARLEFKDLPEPPTSRVSGDSGNSSQSPLGKTTAEQAVVELGLSEDKGYAKVYTATEPEGILLDAGEARQLRKLLNIL